MHHRHLSRIVGLGLFVLAGQAHARGSIPGAIKTHVGLDAAPACTLCHSAPSGGSGTATKPFVLAMFDANFVVSDKNSVGPALDALESDGSDVDGDGVGDVQELRDGTDPNVADAVATSSSSGSSGAPQSGSSSGDESTSSSGGASSSSGAAESSSSSSSGRSDDEAADPEPEAEGDDSGDDAPNATDDAPIEKNKKTTTVTTGGCDAGGGGGSAGAASLLILAALLARARRSWRAVAR